MSETTVARCEVCGLRRRAERKPGSLIARLWRWHTRWCPGWKAYQRELALRGSPAEGAGDIDTSSSAHPPDSSR